MFYRETYCIQLSYLCEQSEHSNETKSEPRPYCPGQGSYERI